MKKVAILISIVTVITGQINLEELIVIPSEKVQHTKIQTINPNQNSMSGAGAAIATGTASPARNSVNLTSTVTLTLGGSGTVGIYYNLTDSNGTSTWYSAGVTLSLGFISGIFNNAVTISSLTKSTTYSWKAALAYTSNGVIIALGGTKEFTTLANSAPIISSINDTTVNKNKSLELTLSASDTDNDAISFTAKSDNASVTPSISSTTLTLTPTADWTGIATITVQASDGTDSSSTSFKLTVQNTVSITAVSSTVDDGTYIVGSVIPISVTFDDKVTVTGTPQLELATRGSGAASSLSFDGSDDYVSISASSLFKMNSFTISGYIKTTKTNGYIFQAEASYGYHLLIENQKPSLVLWYNNTGNGCSGNTSINDGNWHHVAAVYNGTQSKLYIDGNLDKTCDSGTLVSRDGSSALTIGSGDLNASAYNFKGTIDEVAIWNDVLTATEITALYNSGHGLSAEANSGNYTSSSNLVGYWKFNEGTGTSATDASSNSNTGTISGTSWSTDSPIGGGTKVDYTSGTTTTSLIFKYIVASGDSSSDLEYVSTSALTLNGGSISSSSGLDVDLLLPAPGSQNSLGGNKNIVIIGNSPPVIAAVSDVAINEDESSTVTLSATDADGDAITYSAVSDTNAVTVSVSSATLTLTPNANWHGVANIKAYASDGSSKDSTSFKLTVTPVQDKPYNFNWVSTASDSINITQSNLTDTYDLKWNTSNEVDGETIDYLISASVGQFPAEMIHDTTDTSMTITYQDIIDHWYPNLAMLPRATLKFSVSATDGTDTVKVTGDDRVVFVNRYEYLSTVSEGIPTEFALHENYPNPFNPTTTLRFDLPEVSSITLTIYNMLGQRVRIFNMNDTPAGYHSIKWNATNDLGEQVGAGVYLYQLRANQFVKTRKMVFLK